MPESTVQRSGWFRFAHVGGIIGDAEHDRSGPRVDTKPVGAGSVNPYGRRPWRPVDSQARSFRSGWTPVDAGGHGLETYGSEGWGLESSRARQATSLLRRARCGRSPRWPRPVSQEAPNVPVDLGMRASMIRTVTMGQLIWPTARSAVSANSEGPRSTGRAIRHRRRTPPGRDSLDRYLTRSIRLSPNRDGSAKQTRLLPDEPGTVHQVRGSNPLGSAHPVRLCAGASPLQRCSNIDRIASGNVWRCACAEVPGSWLARDGG
jgi:hypothetical protein